MALILDTHWSITELYIMLFNKSKIVETQLCVAAMW